MRNRYVFTLTIFAILMLFIDSNNLIKQFRLSKDLNRISKKTAYYEKEVVLVKEELHDLLTNKETLEKFAREHHKMKKPNEDLFIIAPEK